MKKAVLLMIVMVGMVMGREITQYGDLNLSNNNMKFVSNASLQRVTFPNGSYMREIPSRRGILVSMGTTNITFGDVIDLGGLVLSNVTSGGSSDSLMTRGAVDNMTNNIGAQTQVDVTALAAAIASLSNSTVSTKKGGTQKIAGSLTVTNGDSDSSMTLHTTVPDTAICGLVGTQGGTTGIFYFADGVWTFDAGTLQIPAGVLPNSPARLDQLFYATNGAVVRSLGATQGVHAAEAVFRATATNALRWEFVNIMATADIVQVTQTAFTNTLWFDSIEVTTNADGGENSLTVTNPAGIYSTMRPGNVAVREFNEEWSGVELRPDSIIISNASHQGDIVRITGGSLGVLFYDATNGFHTVFVKDPTEPDHAATMGYADNATNQATLDSLAKTTERIYQSHLTNFGDDFQRDIYDSEELLSNVSANIGGVSASTNTIWIDSLFDGIQSGTMTHPYSTLYAITNLGLVNKTVILMPGTYYFDVDVILMGTNVTLRGLDQKNTILVSTNDQKRIFTISRGVNIVFENMTLTSVNNTNGVAGRGGAIYGACVINDCLFLNCYADSGGGAVYGSYSAVVVEANNCVFSNCTANMTNAYSGAIHNGRINNCVIGNCKAYYCGAMYKGFAIGCKFENCSAGTDANAIESVDARNCTFVDCSGGTNGTVLGGLTYDSSFIRCSSIFGGGVMNGATYNCRFLNCSAVVGGAIYGNVASVVYDAVFSGCTSAGGESGATGGNTTAYNCKFMSATDTLGGATVKGFTYTNGYSWIAN